MKIEEKALRFMCALVDVYRDEENRELHAFDKLEFEDDATVDITAMLLAFNTVTGHLTGYEGDLLDFTHLLNRLAFQYLMEKGEQDEDE